MAIILGIDPGSRVTGYGLINSVGNRLEYIDCGCITTRAESLPERLKKIHNGLCEVIQQSSPQQAAIEEVFMGKNAASALKLGQARGAAMTACLTHDLPIEEYSARKVKQAVVGAGVAEKAQVQHMVKALLNISDTIAEDAADALAVAICHANTQASLIRMAGAKSFSKKRLRR
ncbi:MAG TPA: crossover junction endodeoxyribonuclease RuvC [Gammaproteobacteria bacterium]|jgi:crossover junction endodeoxyribonuclease RuvC|nr:crossover junction endodeoxyribonuclease RuvC [Gammaproteobacteria bacterium]MDP6731997.1 crossover junction endodeoxyribonuclease RuvC [Gammaproteobacteria bacterium]HAJ75079.1 crossover junction endodeoxyribonuclease RuvC [Gammaproteobacteria bacterium]